MAATETYLIPYKMAAIKWDPALVTKTTFTDAITRKLSLVAFKRISDGASICDVDASTGGVWFYDNNWPPPTRVNLTKGITEIEIQ